MIRDILNAVITAINNCQPPGQGVQGAPANTGTGSVVFDASSQVFGTFNGYLVVKSSGVPGVATAQLSLDYGNNVHNPNSLGNLGPVFTLPATPYAVPLPALSPGLGSPGPSGLVLDFSGSFNVNDAFVFFALPQINFALGREESSAQDGLFPRLLFFPTTDEFGGTQDYAQGQDFRTQPRSLTADVARFETHCWGIDYDRTEVLRDTLINGIHFAVQATKLLMGGHWEHDERLNNAGRLYVLNWSVQKPVLQLSQDYTSVPPPFTAALTEEVDVQ